jgi:NAD(P)-dependent dehydrogenase (short-subunit alcohol dehydrogenase family)
MNLATVIAVYAVISRELGLPLRFPGPAEKKAVLITGVHPNRTGTPEELAEAIVFMALPKALFIAGATLVVDGGNSPADR